MNQPHDDRVNFFARCWNGQARLWQAFWLCGVCGKLLVVVLLYFAALLLIADSSGSGLVMALFIGLFMGWYVFAAVSTWRCSRNASHAGWGMVARAITIVAGAMYAAATIASL